MELSPQDFEDAVAEAVRQIPESFRPYLENVEILIEEAPTARHLRELRVPRGGTLLGLYIGVPRIFRPHDYAGLPDRILLFRRPLLQAAGDPAGLRTEVIRTVLHEVAHHFGIGEARLRELGYG